MAPKNAWMKSGYSAQNPFWATKSGCFLTSTLHITSGRAVKLRRTSQGHILDALGSSMAMRHDGPKIGLAMLFHCSHAKLELELDWTT